MMCLLCVEALHRVFPEVPEDEACEFLLNTTCFPFGPAETVEAQLIANRQKMTTPDYKECYSIVEHGDGGADQQNKLQECYSRIVELESAIRNLQHIPGICTETKRMALASPDRLSTGIQIDHIRERVQSALDILED